MEIAPERKVIQTIMHDICNSYDKWVNQPADTSATIIRRMERNCFEVALESSERDGIARYFTNKKFVDRYSAICFKVLANLDVKGVVGSTYLLDGLIDKSIDPYDVAKMDSVELCPIASAEERNMIALRRNQKYDKKTSSVYVCYKCGANSTQSLQYQSRALDEMSSISIKCMKCGTVWRK